MGDRLTSPDGPQRLPDSLHGDVLVAARSLLGAVISRGPVAVRVVEVEAYDGPTDPAAHTYLSLIHI